LWLLGEFAVPVPEPTALSLAASVALGATMWLRRRRD